MTGPIHTYGPSCLLVDEQDLTDFRASSPPDIQTQFFYYSALSIDDPLAPLPPLANQAAGTERLPPKPFSARDNIALEEAWHALRETRKAKNAECIQTGLNTSTQPSGIAVPGCESRSNVEPRCKTEPSKREDLSVIDSRGSAISNPSSLLNEPPTHSHKGHITFAASSADKRPLRTGKEDGYSSSDDEVKRNKPKGILIDISRACSSSLNESSTAKRRSSSPPEAENIDDGAEIGSPRGNRSRDVSISGSPFMRAPISQPQTPLARSFETSLSKEGGQEGQADLRTSVPRSAPKPSGLRTSLSLDQLTQDSQEERTEEPDKQSKIPVGVSRLHLVELPNLKVSQHVIPARSCDLVTLFSR